MADNVEDIHPKARSCLTRLDLSLYPGVVESIGAGKTHTIQQIQEIMKDKMLPMCSVLTVGFMEGTEHQKNFVKETVMTKLQPLVNIEFVFLSYNKDPSTAIIRITFDEAGGVWSMLGTDMYGVPPSQPTMNLGWLGRDNGGTVILHEFGHALCVVHEHSHQDKPFKWNKEAVYKTFTGPPNNWDRKKIEQNIFDTVNTDQFIDSTYSPNSIMGYLFSCDLLLGKPKGMNCGSGIPVNHINEMDKKTWRTLYPPNIDRKLCGQGLKGTGGLNGNEKLSRVVVKKDRGFDGVQVKRKESLAGASVGSALIDGVDDDKKLGWKDITAIVLGILAMLLLIAVVVVLLLRHNKKKKTGNTSLMSKTTSLE